MEWGTQWYVPSVKYWSISALFNNSKELSVPKILIVLFVFLFLLSLLIYINLIFNKFSLLNWILSSICSLDSWYLISVFYNFYNL